MILLQPNDRIRLEDGREAQVCNLLGEGAQGAVYSVIVGGSLKALKMFRYKPSEAFIKNIRKNIAEGAPSPLFLWPEALTKPKDGSRGYLMPLKPAGSFEFSQFRLAKVRFASFKAIINSAINLCDAFRLLHAHGLSYQDLNDGGFFINPNTGEVGICDCDNVFPHGENSGILGKARYMAPEVVMGKTLPNIYSDRFSLSVILFMLFCIDHPFEGINVVKRPCMTEEIEQRLFGQDILFVYDSANSSNRPVHGVHRNVLTMWPLLPETLRAAFVSQFSSEVISNPTRRMTEMQWAELFVKVRDSLVRCVHCGDETFFSDGGRCMNRRCNKPLTATFTLKGGGRHIPLIAGNIIRLTNSPKPTAAIMAKPGFPDILILKNLSGSQWMVHTPSGKSITVTPEGYMPVKDSLSICLTLENQPYKLTIKK